jgi:hypothetical protein
MTLTPCLADPDSDVRGTLVMAASRSDAGGMHSWAGEGGNKPWPRFVQ